MCLPTLDPLLQSVSVETSSGSASIILSYTYPSGSRSTAQVRVREKSTNNESVSIVDLSSPVEFTVAREGEYEIAAKRAPESGEPRQAFQISSVVLTGGEFLFTTINVHARVCTWNHICVNITMQAWGLQ